MRRYLLPLLLLALVSPAQAEPQRARITSVGVDDGRTVLLLDVEGLPPDGAVEVRLDGRADALAIVRRHAGRIEARLPDGLGWARYIVRVVPAAWPERAGEADFVFGVIGPPVGDP